MKIVFNVPEDLILESNNYRGKTNLLLYSFHLCLYFLETLVVLYIPSSDKGQKLFHFTHTNTHLLIRDTRVRCTNEK